MSDRIDCFPGPARLSNGMGVESGRLPPELLPPPAAPRDWWMVVGWGLIVATAVGMFWGVTSGPMVGPVRRNRRSSRRVSRRRSTRNPRSNERFRVYDAGEPGDRYTVVDSLPIQIQGQNIRFYLGMDAHPFHPQGIGHHGEFDEEAWNSLRNARFRNLGKRIRLGDLPSEALKAAKQFVREQEAYTPSPRRSTRKNPRNATVDREIKALAGLKLTGETAMYNELMKLLRKKYGSPYATGMEVHARQEVMRLEGRRPKRNRRRSLRRTSRRRRPGRLASNIRWPWSKKAPAAAPVRRQPNEAELFADAYYEYAKGPTETRKEAAKAAYRHALDAGTPENRLLDDAANLTYELRYVNVSGEPLSVTKAQMWRLSASHGLVANRRRARGRSRRRV